MALNSFSSNQGTQTPLLTDNTGGTAGTLIPVMKIDYSAQGTAGSVWPGYTPDISTAGTLSGTQSLPMNADGLTTISAQITNTFTGTVLAEASLNGGTTWNPTTMVILNSGSIANSLTGPALVQISAAGLGSVRLRANTISSGSAFIFMRGNYAGAANVMLDNSLPIGANTIGNIGSLLSGTINTGTFSLNPLPGSVLTTAVTIGTAGTAAIPTTPLTNRKSIIGYNTGTVTVYIGGTGVTTTTGIPIGTAQYTPAIDLGTASLYGVAASAGGTIVVLEAS